MDKTVVKKLDLHQRTNDLEYWLSRSPEERLEAVNFLLEQYLDLHDEIPRRLQRVYKVIERKRG
jgi:hypothetical protein